MRSTRVRVDRPCSFDIVARLCAVDRLGFRRVAAGRGLGVHSVSAWPSALGVGEDVRRRPARDGFGAMVACAKALVARLDATIVDDYNQPLSDAALTEIAGQVQDFYNEMNDADIPAGSTRAMRLFS